MARRPIVQAAIDRIAEKRPVIGALLKNVERTLRRDDVPINNTAVPEAAAKVVTAIEASPDVAVVAVKSGWFSKINRTAIAAPVATALAWIGLDVSPETLLAIFAGIQALQSTLTIVFKTWFTKTITPQSS